MIKAVIFDIDGTLLDSVGLHAEAWVRTFKEFGKKVSLIEAKKIIGMGSDQFLGDYFSEEEVEKDKEKIDEYRSELFAREYMSKVKPFPKVRELFLKLKEDEIKIALASSATQGEVEKYEEIADIKDLVEKKTSSDDADESKPEPDIFLSAYDKLGKIEKKQVLVIGDTPYDAIAAKKAGLAAIGVLTGGWLREQLLDSGCDKVFSDIEEICQKHYKKVFQEKWLNGNNTNKSSK